MGLRLAFLLDIVGVFLAFGVVAGLYIWPRLKALPRPEALRILALPHMFRFEGLSLLFPGVVSPLLPAAAAIPAAWGDFGAAILALVAVTALTRRWPFAIPLVWLLNVWGTLDLLNAYYRGLSLNIDAGLFGAAFYLPALVVPPLLVLHGMSFMLLVRRRAD